MTQKVFFQIQLLRIKNQMTNLGKYLVIIGLIIVAIGGIIWISGNKSGWFGNMPGDIKIKRDNFSFYIPITTMILLSIILSLLMWLINKFIK